MKYFIILLMSMTAEAGVRGVGKGGGYAEMQALQINQRLATLTQTCTQTPTFCQMNAYETQSILNVVTTTFNLELDPACSSEKIQVKAPLHAILSSCDLYNLDAKKNTVAKKFYELARLILSTRLQATANFSTADADHLAGKVFEKAIQFEQNLAINLLTGNYLFHVLNVESQEISHNSFSIEGAKTSVDITPAVLQALQCTATDFQPNQMQLLSAKTLSATSALFETTIEWRCGSSPTWHASLQVFFETAASEVIESEIHIRLVNKTTL